MIRRQHNPEMAELDGICRWIETNWPGVVAAHTGFAKPRVVPEDTDHVIEVFFVSPDDEPLIIRQTYTLRKRLRRTWGGHTAIICHDAPASRAFYLEDVKLILAARPETAGFVSREEVSEAGFRTSISSSTQNVGLFQLSTSASGANMSRMAEENQWQSPQCLIQTCS